MNARPLIIMFRLAVLLLVISVLILGGTAPAVAWDSVPYDHASHWQFLRDAVNDLYSESPTRYGELRAQLSMLHDGSVNEDGHSQRRATGGSFPSEFYRMAVGNNPGNTHPEYYWQTAIYHYRKYLDTHTPSELEAAYFYLGSLIHIIEDMSAPPHVYNAMHGGPYGLDNFEVLSFGHLDYDYYRHPDSLLQPGKNILDVDDHGDDDYLEATLRKCQDNWVEIFQTNLQAPAARTVKVYTYNPPGWPVFYLKFNYQTLVNGIYQEATHESGAMCAAYTCDKPYTHEWSDNFAPNTTLRVSYRRPECGWFVYDRDVQFKIYVRDSQDVRNEMRDPEFTNPWEYADWLRTWTREHATAAPFWRRYWHDGGRGDLKFDILWSTAPNSERALLSMLDRATQETVKWVLRSAAKQFEALRKDRNVVTDEDAIGRYSYRVAVYEDINYNSTGDTSPEYLKSLSFTCTPYPGKPCSALVVSDLSWIGGMVSSVAVRNATVTLYSGRNQTGTRVELAQDTTWLGDYNDRAWSLMITPRFNVLNTLNVRSFVDGGSRLIQQGDAVYWRHYEKAAPGRLWQSTVLNGTDWLPTWPDQPTSENRNCGGCESSRFKGVPPLAPQAQVVTLDIVRARKRVEIIQQPDQSNGFTLIVEFDDIAPPGADWYEINLTYQGKPTAIDLLSFTAQAGADRVTLAWETGTEVDNAGFDLWRSEAADGEYAQINGALIPAEGDAVSGASYTYDDANVVQGVTYYYRLEDVDVHGASTFHGPVSATPGRIHLIYLPLVLK